MSYRRCKEDGERSARFYNRFRERAVKSSYKRERFRYWEAIEEVELMED